MWVLVEHVTYGLLLIPEIRDHTPDSGNERKKSYGSSE